MKLRLLILAILMVAVASCSLPGEIRLHNYSAGQIDVRLGEESNLVDPGESIQFSLLAHHIFSIVVDGQHLRYEAQYPNSDYWHQTRCGWWLCEVLYFRFDDDRRIRILHPDRRNDVAIPQIQPEGFPLEPAAD